MTLTKRQREDQLITSQFLILKTQATLDSLADALAELQALEVLNHIAEALHNMKEAEALLAEEHRKLQLTSRR